jgi:hypothetical protein
MQSAQVVGGPGPSEIKNNSGIARTILLLKRIPALHAAIPKRALGQYYLANNQPEQAVNWLQPFFAQHPTDVSARLALGNAHYALRHGAESADQYRYLIDYFEQFCCDPQREGYLHQQWTEVRRRVLEADLLDAYAQVQTAPDSARVLEAAESTGRMS